MIQSAQVRRVVSWALGAYSFAAAAFGWYALYALARTFAAGTAWWVGVIFFSSVPAAIAALLLARSTPSWRAVSTVGSVALALFVMLWAFILLQRVLPERH